MASPPEQFDLESIITGWCGLLNPHLFTDPHSPFRRIIASQSYQIEFWARTYEQIWNVATPSLVFKTNLGAISIDRYLAEAESVEGSEERLPIIYFTDPTAERRLYQLADARNRVVINASWPFDRCLLFDYTERHNAEVYLQPVDDVEGPGLFDPLSKDELSNYRFLANDATKCLRRAAINDVEIHVRRFAPASVAAVILKMQGRRGDAWVAPSLLDPLGLLKHFPLLMDTVPTQKNRAQRYLVLNADNTLITSLAQAEVRSTVGDEVIVSLYVVAQLGAFCPIGGDDLCEHILAALEKAIRWRSALTWFDRRWPDGHEALH